MNYTTVPQKNASKEPPSYPCAVAAALALLLAALTPLKSWSNFLEDHPIERFALNGQTIPKKM